MVGLLGMMGRSDAVEGGSVMRRWTGPVTMLVLFSFLAVGPITHTPRAEADCGSAGCAAPVACNTHAGACWVPATNARWTQQAPAGVMQATGAAHPAERSEEH